MQLKNDFLKVFSSNFINIIIGLITGLLIPAFLSLDEYAYLKTFTLYVGYVGILHFGFNDGIYLKYGGKSEKDIDIGRLKGEHNFLLVFQLFVTLITSVFGIILDNIILMAFAISIFPINMQSLFKSLYQALGEFNIYSKILILTPNLLLVFNIIIIFVLKINDFLPFIIANIAAYYIVFIGLELFFHSKYRSYKTITDYTEIWTHITVGFLIMIGNLSTIFISSVDRWFVNIAFTTHDFAFYSFALSMVGIVQMLISTVTMIFYPYIARSRDKEKLKTIKIYLLIIGVFASGAYFAFDIGVSIFLEKYIPSLDVISILFLQFPVMVVINAIFINLYKVNKQEKKYVVIVFKMCILSVVFNILAILLSKSNLSIALATTITYFIWYIYSYKDFPFLKTNKREVIYLGLFFIMFTVSTLFFDVFWGLIFYFIVIYLITLILYKNELLSLINEVLGGRFPRILAKFKK